MLNLRDKLGVGVRTQTPIKGPYKRTQTAELDAYLGGAAVDERLVFFLFYCGSSTAAHLLWP